MSDKSSTPEGAFSSEGRKGPGSDPMREEPADAFASIEKPRPQSFWQRHGTTVLVAAVAAVVATTISIVVQVWLARPPGRPDGPLLQEGSVIIALNAEREVFYPIPYAGPPNLVLDGGDVNWNAIKLKEQKADHFTIQCTANMGFPASIHWRADGMRAPPPPK
jgi:hypothetical protein